MPQSSIKDVNVIDSTTSDPTIVTPVSLTVSAEADPTEEYINSLPWGGLPSVRALPPWIDELERDFGIDIYDRMMDEATVSSQTGILISAALGHDMDLAPIRGDRDADFEDAVKMRDFVAENIERMEDTDFLPYLYAMGEGGFSHGHQVSEVVYELADSSTVKTGGPYYMWKRLKPKSQLATSIVVDPHDNIVGYMHGLQGLASNWDVLIPESGGEVKGYLPKSKVPQFTYMMNHSDPRGRAGLRPAYHPWWMLQEAFDNARKFMRLFGVPPIWTTLPPNATDSLVDPVTHQPLARPQNAAEIQNSRAKALRASGIATFGYGATANTLEPRSEGAFIMNQIALNRTRIANAITFQELATSDPGGSSRALGAIHQDMFGIRTAFIRYRMAAFFRNRLCVPLIDLNFGPRYRYLAPRVRFGSVELNDLPSVGIMVARLLAAGAIRIDQLPEIYEILNLPPSQMLQAQIDAAIKQLDAGVLLDAQGMPAITVQNGAMQNSSRVGSSGSWSGTEPGSGSREDMTRDYGMPGNA